MSAPISPENLLQHMAVPTKPAVYQIGCLERRVTLYSQQVRALNLVFALFDQKKLAPGGRVIVVGGGGAGITAAAALADRGAAVTLLERLDTVMPFQSGNLTRWLHPHIYEWPAAGCRNRDAGLPLLSWSAGYAAEVAETLREEFYRCARRAKKLEVETGVRSVKLHPGPAGDRLEWNDARGRFRSEPFDVLILAVGFGLERSSLGAVLSYWRNDDLAQPELDEERRRHYLISGCGDGGLVDLLRIRIRDFRHDRMLEEFMEPRLNRELEEDLLLVEESARQKAGRGEDPTDFLYDAYQRLRPIHVDEKIAGRLRQDTRATLNGPGRFPWDLTSSILNRFLTSALVGLQKGEAVGADWWRGTITHIGQEHGEYVVQLHDGENRKFDRVILRHGPGPTLAQWIPKAELDTLRFRNALDQTRVPAWPEGYFGKAPSHPRHEKSSARTIQVLFPSRDGGVRKLQVDLGITQTFGDLTDLVFGYIDPPVPVFTYGQSWHLRNMISEQRLRHARELEGKRFGQYVPDRRTLEQAGVLPGDILEVSILKA